MMNFLILCGGKGSKLWPLSRESCPKQFLKMFNGKSLFQINWETLKKRFNPQNIFLQTHQSYVRFVLIQAPDFLRNNIFIEPETKNQGPAIGLGVARLFLKAPDIPFMLIQSDVMRTPVSLFVKFSSYVEKLVHLTRRFVTGIARTRLLHEGVDFVLPGEHFDSFDTMRTFSENKLILRGSTVDGDPHSPCIHANHFSWTPRELMNAYASYAPEWYYPIMEISKATETIHETEVLNKEYAQIPSGTLENRILSRIFSSGYVVECPFKWKDFGTWRSFFA